MVQRNNAASKTPSLSTNLISTPLHLWSSCLFSERQTQEQTPQTLSLLLSFPNSNFLREKIILESWYENLCVYFVVRQTPFHSSRCVYSCRFRVSFATASEPLLGQPGTLAQLDVDLAGHCHSGRQFQPSTKVMKEDSVPGNPSFTHVYRGEEAPRGRVGLNLWLHSHNSKSMFGCSEWDGASMSHLLLPIGLLCSCQLSLTSSISSQKSQDLLVLKRCSWTFPNFLMLQAWENLSTLFGK